MAASLLNGDLLNFGESRTLSLPDISPDLSSMQASGPLATFGETPIAYISIGEPKYDGFFLNVARLRGAIQAARMVLADTRASMQDIAQNLNLSADDALPLLAGQIMGIQDARLTQFQDRLDAVEENLKKLNGACKEIMDAAKELPKTGGDLIGQVKQDFQGGQAQKAIPLVKGLSDELPEVMTLLEELPPLLEEMGKTLEAFAPAG